MVMSPVDIEYPDLARFPRFSEARRVECELGAGDVLFMPAFWWHEVRSHPDPLEMRNMAVNFWSVGCISYVCMKMSEMMCIVNG